jgi:ribosomal protein L24E
MSLSRLLSQAALIVLTLANGGKTMTRTCDWCGQHYNADHAGVTKEMFFGQGEVKLYFCSRKCMHEQYLDSLRKEMNA